MGRWDGKQRPRYCGPATAIAIAVGGHVPRRLRRSLGSNGQRCPGVGQWRSMPLRPRCGAGIAPHVARRCIIKTNFGRRKRIFMPPALRSRPNSARRRITIGLNACHGCRSRMICPNLPPRPKGLRQWPSLGRATSRPPQSVPANYAAKDQAISRTDQCGRGRAVIQAQTSEHERPKAHARDQAILAELY